MRDLYQSQRLCYRAVDIEKDEAFFRAIRSDSVLFQLSNGRLALPQKPSDAKEEMKYALEKCFLGVVICLKSKSLEKVNKDINDDDDDENIPIGVFYMINGGPLSVHHRQVEIGIIILPKYQGKGYGPEVIVWGTGWAFDVAGMHRVQVKCFEFNKRALHTYQKLGFKLEGTGREAFWHDGKFWDDIQFGMLDREWNELKVEEKTT